MKRSKNLSGVSALENMLKLLGAFYFAEMTSLTKEKIHFRILCKSLILTICEANNLNNENIFKECEKLAESNRDLIFEIANKFGYLTKD